MKKFSACLLTFFMLAAMFSFGISASAKADKNLTLVSSSVISGDTNVSQYAIIELKFSGKVDSLDVLNENCHRFHLTDASGNIVPITVTAPDVQLQRRFQQHFFVRADDGFTPGASYTLTIDRGFSDKNGVTTAEPYAISFKASDSADNTAGNINNDLEFLKDNILVFRISDPLNENSYASGQENSAAAETQNKNQTSKTAKIDTVRKVVIPLILVIIAVSVFFGVKNRKKSSDA